MSVFIILLYLLICCFIFLTSFAFTLLAVVACGLYISGKGYYLQLTNCITPNGSVRRPMFIFICLRKNSNNGSSIPSTFIPILVSVWNDDIKAENEQLNIIYAQQMGFELLRCSLRKAVYCLNHIEEI